MLLSRRRFALRCGALTLTTAGLRLWADAPDFRLDPLAVLRANLQRVAAQRVLMVHGRCGTCLLDGVRALSQQAGIAVQIQALSNAAEVGPGTLGHVKLDQNAGPAAKLLGFEAALNTQASGLDVAMLAFDTTDFGAQTDGKALFAQYRAAVERLRAQSPGLRFVHITAPLTAVDSGPLARLLRLLGQAPHGIVENSNRDDYNELLRQTFQGREPVFDLALLQSTLTDGTVWNSDWQGRTVPALVPAYTDDDVHLNPAGQQRGARSLIALLADGTARALP